MPDPSLIFSRPIISGSGMLRSADGVVQNCSVELLGLAIYGDYRHGYDLPCIDAGCQRLVVAVQDRLPDDVRQSRRWRLLVARLSTCHNTGSDRVARRMALWAARRAEHLASDPRAKKCNDMLERWLAGEATDEELLEAATEPDSWSAAGWAAKHAATEGFEAEAASVAAIGVPDPVAFVDDYLTAWFKVAADEGCLLPDESDAEYVAFLAALDFMEGAQAGGS